MASLKISLIQSNLFWEDVSANLQMFSDKLLQLPPTNLVVLPEMFSTAFSMNAERLAEPMDGSAVKWMQKMADEKNAVVTGSLMLKEPSAFGKSEIDNYFNRLVWMPPGGRYQTYDKRHLFGMSNEEKMYTPGNQRIVVELNGWKICPLICYDLRFPAWSRNLGGKYDVLLYVANWPEKRVQAWKYLLIARAIENQCYVVGVNRVGNDGNDMYHSGDSMVVDPLGNVLYHKQHAEDVATIELDYNELEKARSAFPFLKDADSFVIDPKTKIKGH